METVDSSLGSPQSVLLPFHFRIPVSYHTNALKGQTQWHERSLMPPTFKYAPTSQDPSFQKAYPIYCSAFPPNGPQSLQTQKIQTGILSLLLQSHSLSPTSLSWWKVAPPSSQSIKVYTWSSLFLLLKMLTPDQPTFYKWNIMPVHPSPTPPLPPTRGPLSSLI